MVRSREAETICRLSAEKETLQVSECGARYRNDGLSSQAGDLREDITSVSNELPGGQTSVQVPKPQGLVPTGRKGELTVGRDGNVRDKVVVSV
jgi:hypothetical protein